MVTPLQTVNLLSVASEMYPFIKTGGLADVVGSLPAALEQYGIAVRTLIPGYPCVLKKVSERTVVKTFENVLGHEVTLWSGVSNGQQLYILESPELFTRTGNPYCCAPGADWSDNGLRFAVLSRIGASIAQGCLTDWAPDVVQTHDWQTGLLAAYLHYDAQRTVPTVHTVHNLAFQGIFPQTCLHQFGLPHEAFSFDGVEYYGQISFLKAALQFSTRLIAVSPTYAEEIKTAEMGMGLNGLLKSRSSALIGILNGLDTVEWNPLTDQSVRFPYKVGDALGRAPNKRAFQAEFGLPQNKDTFLLGLVSRLTTQKGIDILADIIPDLSEMNIQLVVVGTGDPTLARRLSALQNQFPRQVACYLNYSETLAHRLHASVDASLIPSRFEPCGLTQMQALRYGAVPIAARVGGLSDTIVDANSAAIAEGVANGILFTPTDPSTLLGAIRKAHSLFGQKSVWARLQRNGSLHDVSWLGKAGDYSKIFMELAGHTTSLAEHDGDIAPRKGDVAPRAPKMRSRLHTARMPRASAFSPKAEALKLTGTRH